MSVPLIEGPFTRRSTDATAFLRQRADAAFVATLKGWGGIRAGRVRQRPTKVHWAEQVDETGEPDRRTFERERIV